MRSPQEYLASILDGLQPLAPVRMPIAEIDGCVLAEDVHSKWALPTFDNSAMDGYAARSADLLSADVHSPVELTVIEDIPAGTWPSQTVTAGTCARIMTGAPMPPGADCVVRVEDTDAGMPIVGIHSSARSGRDVRRIGEDIQEGQRVLQAGQRMNARTIALLAASGHAQARVQPRARVVIVSTGSELVEPGQPLAPGQISDVNGVMLEACIRTMGAAAQRWPSIGDDPGLLARTLQQGAAEFDLVLTTGGVSMGAYDTVKQVLTQLGAAHFEKVAMQPGMPQGHGRIGANSTPIITLPGNPVSAFVSAQVFVRPLLDRLHGQAVAAVVAAHAVSAESFTSPAGKVQYVRAKLTQDSPPLAHPTGVQGSHILGGLADADCLLVVPAEVQRVERGDVLEMLDLRQESR